MDIALLHGGGQGSWVWDETIAALRSQAQGRLGRTLALDVPGCGTKRDRPTGNLDNQDIARELVSDLERSSMRDVILVGHSQGGQVLPLMAELRPDLFRQIVYVSCAIPLPGQNVLQMMGKGPHGSNEDEVGFPDDPAASDATRRYALMFCNDMGPEQSTQFLVRLGKDSWPTKSYSFTDWRYDQMDAVPSTYVVALRDNSLPLPWQQRFADRYKVRRRVSIDAGHQVMNTRPQALAEVILSEGAR
jgi:pimeloyl-ACP methyl ester carboxylesterase